MDVVSKEIAHVEQAMSDTSIYDSSRKEDLKLLLEKQTEHKQKLEKIESEWLKINEELEQLRSN
jgi:ATP-binding cassette subfamily F protein 3